MSTRYPLCLYKFIKTLPSFRDAIRTNFLHGYASASLKHGGARESGLWFAVAALAFCVCTPAVLADTWSTKAPAPTPRPSLAGAAIDGNLYAVGGFLDSTGKRTPAVEVYDPTTDRWTTKAPMLTARDATAAGVINGKLYIAGGLDDSHHVSHLLEVYDPATDSWTTAASMPTGLGLCYAAAGVIDGKLYVAGGQSETSGQTPVSTLEMYDPMSDTWTVKTSMPTARTTVAGAAANGRLYVAGGYLNGYLSTLEVYDPASDTWTTASSMPTARSFAAAAGIDGKFYVVGGGSTAGIFGTLEVYDPGTDMWTTETPMPTVRSTLAAAAIDGNLYAVGGVNTSGDLSTLEVFGTSFNLPPVAVIAPTSPVECASYNGTQVTLDGSGSYNPDGGHLTYAWSEDGNPVGGNTPTITVTVPLGIHKFSLTVTDPGGLGNTTTTQVTVQDTTPPSLSIALAPNILWPPNHKLVPITAAISTSDTCVAAPQIVLVSITANEPLAPGEVQGAAFGTDDSSFNLAATRLGSGDGRSIQLHIE